MRHQIEGHRFEMHKLGEEEGGGYAVTFPDLPGCVSDGENSREAIRNARAALMAWPLPNSKSAGQNANTT
jgi:antitoxin HicB